MTNPKSTSTFRLKRDYLRLKKDPIPYITAEPMPSNILEWHYVIKGPDDSPYQGGYYHGTILFPREFPFKPPSIYVLTPNGRFKTNRSICLSITDMHPLTWNPTWSIGSILNGLLSFMLESEPTLGSMESSIYEKQQYAKKSLEFNLKNAIFCELFPQICEEIKKQQQAIIDGTSSSKITGRNNSLGIYNNSEVKSNANGDIPNDIELNESNKISNSHSMYTNLLVILSFAIFTLIVNYVIENLN